jgi:hypothetical protein
MSRRNGSTLCDGKVPRHRCPCIIKLAKKTLGVGKIRQAKTSWVLTMCEVPGFVGFRVAQMHAPLEARPCANEIPEMKARHPLRKMCIDMRLIALQISVVKESARDFMGSVDITLDEVALK